MLLIYSLLLNDGFRILLAFLFSLILSLYGIPVLVRIANNHSMYDHPNGRTTHLHPTPRLAGIAMFLTVILSVSLLSRIYSFPGYQFAVAGSIIIFFIGIKDDMMGITFSKKFIAQFECGTRKTWRNKSNRGYIWSSQNSLRFKPCKIKTGRDKRILDHYHHPHTQPD